MDVIDPWNLPLKFGQNRVSNSWDINEVEVPVVVFVVVGGRCVKPNFCHDELSWVTFEPSLILVRDVSHQMYPKLFC